MFHFQFYTQQFWVCFSSQPEYKSVNRKLFDTRLEEEYSH